MKRYFIPFSVLCVALAACQCEAFLLSSDCPAPSPCTCSGSSESNIYIYCGAKHLTTVPQFGQYNTNVISLTIYLNSNSLTSILNYAFRNLDSINASSIDFQLQDNHIHMIENDAFKYEEKITSLQLQNNNLTAIPFAISKLTKIKSLDVSGNPLRSIDSSVMPSIGRSLNYLKIDLGAFTEWPADLHYLSTLQRLEANYIPFARLDVNAFRGLETTLSFLAMYYSKLEKIPYAVCQLTHLRSLIFKSSTNLNQKTSSIFEPCGHTLPGVKFLDLDSNRLQYFPDISSLFPSLSSFAAFDNRFQYIEIDAISKLSNLTDIILQLNMFERIPSALNKLTYLDRIDLRINKIRTIESADLYGLSNLRILLLSYNPIAYIEPDAFSRNFNIAQLLLKETQLVRIPKAVTYLPNLTELDLDRFDCTCEMSYLKNWNVSALTSFNTLCARSSETIKTFVMYSLQSCR